ncbi:uncharacterized protein FOMMEDRAFT_131079 [Fomitiporia mediterranea MF3/22]|uniref:uncharacterized protein n=1 Tax=Fomitiporia mediterranea (strain MF3/22) TaxID=694068 RepID=UPI000440854D|nr:uncharacterized protein FOMMEDRAFT_131079 [Fomitiporia mediterranea MF3/22]EJD08159.1 hypothetical protein FOMMEDRAFT_131079 [Fomitiporia mediterranea MF3/22]
MSHIDSLTFMKDSDIQRCCDLVKSILDYGLNIRQPIVREVLGSLNPIPTHWKRGRTVSSVANTDELFTSDDGRANKS